MKVQFTSSVMTMNIYVLFKISFIPLRINKNLNFMEFMGNSKH